MKVKHALYGLIGCMAALQVNEAFAYDQTFHMGLQLLQMNQPGYNSHKEPWPGYYQQQQFQQTELLKNIEHTQRQMYYEQRQQNDYQMLQEMQ